MLGHATLVWLRGYLASGDVVHAFRVPEFLFKRHVIPGHPDHFAITATQTGTFTGHCSELCGLLPQLDAV